MSMDTTLIDPDRPNLSNSPRPSLLRPAGSRPAPLGPRLRQASTLSTFSLENSTRNGSPSQRQSTISRTSSRSRDSSLYSPGPSSPSFLPPASPVRSEHGNYTLSDIAERSADPELPSFEEATKKPCPSRTPSLLLHDSPSPSLAPSPAPSRVPSPSPAPSPAPSSIKVMRKPSATLIPPSQTKFESIPVAWKGLPLEAALWTLDSRELQTIVSRAIRSSARESFIRLISIQQLDELLPAELERLNHSKASIQSRYRFHVQRRTMLLQALMSYSDTGGEKDGGVDLVSRLAGQISEVTIDCDKLAQELVSVVDQISQINKLMDVHWASALAIALRKLNGSYGKRTKELVESKSRVDQLQAELNDAWNEAEKLAREMDDLDETGVYSDEDTDIFIRKAAVVAVPAPSGPNAMSASGRLIDLKPTSHPPAAATAPSESRSESPVESSRPSRPVRTPPSVPEELDETESPPANDVRGNVNEGADDDAVSVHSKRSTKSVKSLGGASRVNLVTAARTRSIRTSLGSLRIPGHRKKTNPASSSGAHSAPVDGAHPPVPSMPQVFSPASLRSPSSLRSASAVSLVDGGQPSAEDVPPVPPLPDSAIREPQSAPTPRPRRTDLEDIKIVPNRYVGDSSAERPLSVMDDILVMPKSGGNDIEEVPRVLRKSVDDVNMVANSRRKMGSGDHGSSTIPSIWLNADTPKTPAERVEALMRSNTSKNHSYHKLKGLTKRYSLPFPFAGKSSSSSNKSSSS